MQFSGQINSLTGIATIANPVYYTESITALSVTQAGWLPCTVYPTVGVYVLRNGTPMTLSVAQLSAGTIVNIPFNLAGRKQRLHSGDPAELRQFESADHRH